MKEFRLGKNDTAHYSSMDSLREAWGKKPVEKKRKKDPELLEKDRNKFLGVCPTCKTQLIRIDGTNVKACPNERCRGIEIKSRDKDEEGNTKSYHIPYTRVIIDDDSNDKTKEIFYNLFD